MKKAAPALQVIDKIDFSETPLSERDYDHCLFSNCNFSGADLSAIHFSACTFDSCNLSLVTLHKTTLRDIRFVHCKIVGVHFEQCNEFLFSVGFDHCTLNLSSFYQVKLKKTAFQQSSLQEMDFTGADLSEALFDHCDLTGATFENTLLERADFRTSYNYLIDPELNRIRKAKFSAAGLAGLLFRYDIEIE